MVTSSFSAVSTFCRYVTMEELLKKLVTQAKQEGRESLRQLVAALNGLAGILCLLKKVGLVGVVETPTHTNPSHLAR